MTAQAADKPISQSEFHARLEALGAPGRIILAVSGGPDSMALLRLSARERGRRFLVVTVDHGLRAAARREAEQAGEWARATGLDHRILKWEGEKPATGVQAAARGARYFLLADCAAQQGFEAVLTGHTADDQAETVFMRLARGSGPAGLGGMKESSLVAAGAGAPVRLLRPMLAWPRARIAATLKEFGQDAVNDPSNDDPSYERIRTRALLAGLAEQSLLTRDALCRTARRVLAAAERLAAAEEEDFNRRGGILHPQGWMSLKDWRGAPPGLIARMIFACGAGDHAPVEEDVLASMSMLERSSGRATLGGALLEIAASNGLCVCREPAALFGRAGVPPLPPLTLRPGDRALWDKRFIVVNESNEPTRIAPAGAFTGASSSGDLLPPAAAATIPVEAHASGPREKHPEILVTPLLEERFSGRVVRFSKG